MKDAAETTSGSMVLRSMRIGEHALFVGLLAIGTVRAVGTSSSKPAIIFIAVALGLWYALGIRLAARHKTRGYGWLWLVILIVGWLVLLAMSAEFSWVAFALFFLVMHLLATPIAVAGVAVLTAAVVAAQVTAGSGSLVPQVMGPILGAMVAVGLTIVYRRLAHESEQRMQLVEQLITAQDDLIAVHDELAKTQREAGAVAERARIARDIHDTLAQGFSSIVLLSRAGLAGARDVMSLLSQIESTAVDNLDEARRVVHALTPAMLEQGSLPGALHRLTDRLTEQAGIATTLRIVGEVQAIPTAHEVALLRAAQSALANVRQHSRATHASLTLSYEDESVRLDVVDDGRGFDPATAATQPGRTGMGLRSMRERLAQLSGRLEVESSASEGTTVTATIPFMKGVR